MQAVVLSTYMQHHFQQQHQTPKKAKTTPHRDLAEDLKDDKDGGVQYLDRLGDGTNDD